MYFRYLRRELAGRRKQSIIIAAGMALAVALVIIVNSVAAGMSNAQASVLESVYGVGTDITVSQTPAAPGEGDSGPGGQRFDFDAGAGTTTDGTTTVNQSRLEAARGTSTLDAAALTTVQGVDNVSAATGTLSLSNTTFNGELPDFSQIQANPGAGGGTPPQGGPDGSGGSAFDVDSFTVLGIDPSVTEVGPLSSLEVTDGRMLDTGDVGTDVVVLDSGYATTESIAVGDTLAVAGTDFQVVGIVTSTTTGSDSASNTYIPLDVAQSLSGLTDQVSSVYVQAASATTISQVQADIEKALPDTTVNTQADLASSVSGSLASASSLLSTLGFWLAVLVLGAAFLISALFTISNVTRRTREFGTLKAIGWSNGRIVKQVAGESTVQAAFGAVAGVVIALIGVVVINIIQPTLSATASTAATPSDGPMMGGPGGPMMGGAADAASNAVDLALQAPVSVVVILIAVGLALLGGIFAGTVGGWRAAKLRPAEALRSFA
ncbi:ABC transporter permease [Klugiella xanthotipulae]|uniref:ABC-type lipoprotein release transport system permease subunit n=1 Tax=Klugiella xanthotipulae TaxID=244735 RepID=A0A543HZB8_9MICO|nr:ABC transporter permease [Klugiella xanthotipulae]TQM63659.1 ABC-type lipoprotein release transport system permease subunit [Klugiella xanthotipulae]